MLCLGFEGLLLDTCALTVKVEVGYPPRTPAPASVASLAIGSS